MCVIFAPAAYAISVASGRRMLSGNGEPPADAAKSNAGVFYCIKKTESRMGTWSDAVHIEKYAAAGFHNGHTVK